MNTTRFDDFGDDLQGVAKEVGDIVDREMDAALIRSNAHIQNGGDVVQVDCVRCKGSGQWRGYARTFPCRACDGSGKVTTRKAAGQKATITRAVNLEAARDALWVEHKTEMSFLHRNAEWSDFYRSLYDQARENGKLSENQWAAVHRGMAKAAERAEQKKAAAPVVDITAIQALFDRAVNNKVKAPVFRATEITLSLAKAHSKNPGALYVTETIQGKGKGAYLGKIVAGKFHAFGQNGAETEAKLRLVAENPDAEAIRYASKWSACSVCGTAVVDPVSVLSVVGPVCAQKWGLEHLREAAREELARMEEEEAQKKLLDQGE